MAPAMRPPPSAQVGQHERGQRGGRERTGLRQEAASWARAGPVPPAGPAALQCPAHHPQVSPPPCG